MKEQRLSFNQKASSWGGDQGGEVCVPWGRGPAWGVLVGDQAGRSCMFRKWCRVDRATEWQGIADGGMGRWK